MAKLVSLREASLLLGSDRRTIKDWVERKGCPVERAGGHSPNGKDAWQLDLGKVLKWRENACVEEALEAMGMLSGDNPSGVTETEAKRRERLAKAIMAEIKASEQLGEVVLVETALAGVQETFNEVRSSLQSLGAKVAGRAATLTDAPAIQKLIDTEIFDTLEALDVDATIADGSPDGDVPGG